MIILILKTWLYSQHMAAKTAPPSCKKAALLEHLYSKEANVIRRFITGVLFLTLMVVVLACGTSNQENPTSVIRNSKVFETTSSAPRRLNDRNEEWSNEMDLNLSELPYAFDLASGENGKVPTIILNSGYEMPIIGLGTYSLLDDICVDSVATALQRGFRKIDTAYMYHNENSVGAGIRQSGVPREEVFVTTKLYPNQYGQAAEAIDEALNKLGVEYIDLLLLHHPGTNDVEAYKAMEQAVADGKIRSIGLSNWYIEEMEKFLSQVTIMPALVQNEIHPYYQENDVIKYMHGKGIAIEAWYPLGGRGYTQELLNDKTILEIAKTHGKSSAQVILRWDLQKGVIVIPGSSNPNHMLENISIFDFELTEEEMRRINALDRNEKHDWY